MVDLGVLHALLALRVVEELEHFVERGLRIVENVGERLSVTIREELLSGDQLRLLHGIRHAKIARGDIVGAKIVGASPTLCIPQRAGLPRSRLLREGPDRGPVWDLRVGGRGSCGPWSEPRAGRRAPPPATRRRPGAPKLARHMGDVAAWICMTLATKGEVMARTSALQLSWNSTSAPTGKGTEARPGHAGRKLIFPGVCAVRSVRPTKQSVPTDRVRSCG